MCLKSKAENEKQSKSKRYRHSLIAIGDLSELTNGHGFLLYVVLSEESRLTSHQLLDGCRDDEVINIVIGCSWLPLLGRNDL